MSRNHILSTCLLLLSTQLSFAQFEVRGSVKSTKQEPIEGASVTIKNSYYGGTTGTDGSFSFQVTDTGKKMIIVTMMGYKSIEREIIIGKSNSWLEIKLKEEISELQAVVITAGSFEASDKKRATVLKSLDIVTTAGQQADLVGSLRTLPGAQQVGEQEGLFIRGGTGAETKVFIDGIMVNNPFFSSVPDVAQRGRFSPLLFKGTVFSSGGYSAQYGQGLSSALILETLDLPSRSEVNMIISSAQMSVMGQKLNKAKNASMGLNVNYSNLQPYFSIVKQRYDYTKAPEILNGEFHARQKFKSGMIKLYAYVNKNEVGFNKPSLDYPAFRQNFHLQNKNIFTTAVYSGSLSNSWQINSGLSFSYNRDDISINTGKKDSSFNAFAPQIQNRILQSRLTFTKRLSGLNKLNLGAEYQQVQDRIFAKDSIPHIKLDDNYLAVFAESDIYFSSRFLSRVGLRTEHSTLLNQTTISPRISLAYKLNDKSQISFAYGDYYQKPEVNYLFRKQELNFTKATHYILNLQRISNGQTLRAEVFYKKYKHLLTYAAGDPFSLDNKGGGYAKGFELFWRDKKSIKDLDYWISYSYLDTKRKYLDYASEVQPSFAAKHTTSVVVKRFVSAISTHFSATYTYASGRPYFNPNKDEKAFMKDRTIDYHSLAFQVNYLATIKAINAVFILNINNLLGTQQVFGYNYSVRKINGSYQQEAVTPMAKRFVFVGMYLSIGSDRRKTILD